MLVGLWSYWKAGRTKLNKYDLIYAGLTDEAFWVSAAKAAVSIDKGRERCHSVEAG